MKWFVSRQCYWGVEEPYVVEIATGGLDYANPDMLVAKYKGEGEEYDDPEEAVEAALEIAQAWKEDQPQLNIQVAAGCTMGFTMPFEPSGEEALREWALSHKRRMHGYDPVGGGGGTGRSDLPYGQGDGSD